MKRPEPNIAPVLEAIESARERLRAMPARTPEEMIALSGAALAEIGKIILTKNAYDDERALLMTTELTDKTLEALFGQGGLMR